MGLTLFTYVSAALMLLGIFRIKRRGRGSDLRTFRVAGLLSVSYAICLATGYGIAVNDSGNALILLRLAAFFAAASYLAFFRLALSYPYPRKLVLMDLALLALGAVALWRFAFTDDYLVQVRRVALEYLRFEGPRYLLLSGIGAGAAILAALVFLIRGFRTASHVYRQQLFVMAAGMLGSTIIGYLVAIYLPTHGLNTIYPIAGISGLVAVWAASYSFSATRIFHVPTLAKTLGAWAVLLLLFVVPLAFLTGLVLLFRLSIPVIVVISLSLGFLLFGRWAEKFSRGRFGSARDEAAREQLESDIAHIDLSVGRDDVLGNLAAILEAEFKSSWFVMLSETDSGDLARVYPGADEALIAPAEAPIIQILASLPRPVVLKTDVIADPSFSASKAELLEFFDALGAEALVVAREGRRVVGVFALGPKRSGIDYDILDYESFSAVYGKLFVVAYYIRHVARESLLATVEKEVGLADQIVKSVQDSIDPIRHPAVDVAYVCRSTRQLGGDLYDAIRISEHRWFFVVGDVSGKGLNASMSMVILKSMIRTLLREEQDFIKLVARTNAFIKEQLPRGTFFAGVFGFIALDKGSVYFINCGIPVIYFRSPGLDTVIEVQGEGKMLGFVRNLEPYLKTRKLALPPGSSLVISTDGIIEAESVRGERYGKEKMVQIVTENRGASAQDIVDAVIKSASSFADGKLEDDITILAINYHGHKEKKA